MHIRASVSVHAVHAQGHASCRMTCPCWDKSNQAGLPPIYDGRRSMSTCSITTTSQDPRCDGCRRRPTHTTRQNRHIINQRPLSIISAVPNEPAARSGVDSTRLVKPCPRTTVELFVLPGTVERVVSISSFLETIVQCMRSRELYVNSHPAAASATIQ